jgi:monovalent cation:H+ antiporter-2, CPA2 family
VIARLLSDLRRLGNRETPAVLSILVLEDFAMAAYLPLLAVLAAGGTWLEALFGMAIAITALSVAFFASYRWGHHVGRIVAHPDNEQMLLRILGLTLIVAALAEFVHASAAVGAFLVGLTLTGESAHRARTVLSPLRDLFAAIFFLAIGVSVDARGRGAGGGDRVDQGIDRSIRRPREGVARPGQLRAGTALIARGEFSLVIIGLVGTAFEAVEAVATPYVFLLAMVGPMVARFTGGRPAPAR